MAVDLKTLFTAYNVKVAEKLNALKTLIDNIDTSGGGGISADVGNDLILGTDSKVYYKRLTAEQWATLYEGLSNTNKFEDSYKLTLDNLDLTVKADLDPATGKLVLSQMPSLNITDTVVVSENTFEAFLLVTSAYTYNEGDVITVVDAFGNTENYLYNGGARDDTAAYNLINPGQVKFYPTAGDRPGIGKEGYVYLVEADATMYLYDAVGSSYVQIGGGGGSGDKNYTHNQGTPAATWVINHNLGKYPAVSVFDSAKSQVEGDVEYTDLNNVTLSFGGAAFSGTATLN